jgi:hypothetical protein
MQYVSICEFCLKCCLTTNVGEGFVCINKSVTVDEYEIQIRIASFTYVVHICTFFFFGKSTIKFVGPT